MNIGKTGDDRDSIIRAFIADNERIGKDFQFYLVHRTTIPALLLMWI